ncbi:MAG: asparagine synthase-related protein, partial [Balneolaceae bacterium]|nr:asparagine synthase-related protein [Balneolaceae bacterium]
IHMGISLKCNDRMNMAKSIESRVPFLDTRLIDFAMHLPAHAKYRDGITKFLLKKLAARYLPPELMYRKKVGFGFSNDLWIGTIDFLNDGWVAQQLKWSKKDMPYIREKIMEDSNLLFKLVTTEIWAKIYFGNEKIENLSEKMQSFA